MPAPKIIRPDKSFDEEKQKALLTYLCDHYDRAEKARSEQMDKYREWEKIYRAIPLEKKRTVPWSGASNLVVPLARIYLDTFVARTLNIIFATRPLYVSDGFPREEKEALELYINRKALYEWGHYPLANRLLNRGNKNGTAVTKTIYVEDKVWQMMPGLGGPEQSSQEVTTFSGPSTDLIQFEDFSLYPYQVEELEKALILFQKVRYVEEEAKQKVKDGKWLLSEEDVESSLKMPADVDKKKEEEADAGLADPFLREFSVVEAHLKWEMQPGKMFKVVCIFDPLARKMADIQFATSLDCVFHDYRPFPRESIFWGESQCQILQMQQEEASRIHNERRDNAFIANAPVFLRKNGSNLPNPSTTWYPGKVWDLDDIADLSVQSFGRNIDSMLDQEAAVYQLADKITGSGPVMQGMSGGQMDKRGVYNTSGTLAVLSESNQRQDTNIRDAREALSRIIKCAFGMQREYGGSDDPTIDMFPPDLAAKIRRGMELVSGEILKRSFFEVKASSAGSNKEVERANLLQMAQVLAQYGQAATQMATELASPTLNAGIKQTMISVITMQRWMAARLLKAWDEADAEGELPDVIKALGFDGGGGQGPTGQPVPGGPQRSVDLGGAAGAGGPLSREGLEVLRSLPIPAQANGGAGGPQGAPRGGPV